MRLWSAQAISLIGDQVSLLALPLTAVLVLHASSVQMGVLVALGGLPSILFGFVIGAWIDRHARRPIMLAADAGRFVLLGSIPLLHATGHLTIGWLYAITFLVGLLSLSFEVANRSLLPILIPRERLIDANGKLELSQSASAIAGPALAGGLVQILTAPLAIGFDALSFLTSAILLKTIDVRESPTREPEEARLWSQVRGGVHFVVSHPVIRAIFASAVTLSFFNTVLEAVFLLFLTRSLGLSPALIGVVAAAGNVGFLVGAMATPVSYRFGTGRTIIGGIAFLGLGDLVIPLLGPATPLKIPLLMAAHFMFGIGLTLYNVNQVSTRQSCTPDRYLGRMNAVYRFLVSGIGPLGALVGGGLGVVLGYRAVLVLASCGELAAMVWLIFSPVRSLTSLAHHISAASTEPATTKS